MAPSQRLVPSLLLAGAVGTVTACGGGGSGAGSDLASMLEWVPDDGASDSQVVYGNLARVRASGDLDVPDDPAEALDDLGDQVAIQGLVIADPLRRAALREEIRDETGFDLADLDASLQAGEPPEQLAVFVGRIDAGDVDDALTSFEPFAEDLDTGEEDGVATYRFGEEGSLSPQDVSAARPLGEAVRLGVVDGTVLWTRSDDVLDDAIDAHEGDGDSLARADGWREVAAVLDREQVHTATLTGDAGPFEAPETDQPVLDRWDVAGLGETITSDGLVLVVALWHDDDEAAEENEARLAEVLADGQSLVGGEPWAERCDDAEVARNGAVVITRCELERPGLALQVLVARDSLIAWA